MGTDLGCQALFKETALNAHFSLLYFKTFWDEQPVVSTPLPKWRGDSMGNEAR